ncbi:MAG: NADP-dependent isocitrate dehydrogenase [Spirochaetes bacterium]|nr:MAG: NADP-dependent isocitrate dehydrogenase [Spirochaetota bacterium]
MDPKIIYTITDEAPMLATRSFLPIIQAFSKAAGVRVETRDISLASRILATFPDYLNENQKVSDNLAELGELVQRPDTNIIKLPNISASIPQIQAAVKELNEKGFAIPDFPEDPETYKERAIRSRYDKIKGSAVNPVLREGNSDRRSAPAVKNYARSNPHTMGEWNGDSKTHVSSMDEGDFYGSEKSTTINEPSTFRIEFVNNEGTVKLLKEEAPLEAGEILDAAVMSRKALQIFLDKEIRDAADKKILFSIHLKATMMKVSDPIIFGHAVSVFFKDVFNKHEETLKHLGVNPDNGMADLLAKIATLPREARTAVEEDIKAAYASGPDLVMVNPEKGITNLHVPSDIIIDASMPAAIRNSGKMWGPDGKEHDMKAVIPDRCYAGVYRTVVDFCKKNGAFNPATMGSVSNVGLMAQKAEEYGSHDKTFTAPGSGVIRAVDAAGKTILEQPVEDGDIFRMCQVKDAPVQDWVKLAVNRTRATGNPAVFWLDENRAHDAQMISKVKSYLKEYDTAGLDISIMEPSKACQHTLERTKAGKDTISVTGNVLRDYLTDLFPILELGTSAKMLSIVPLMNGGGLFETGAGGSAPKHVQQLLEENHLRWDSLGEFLALAQSFEYLANTFSNEKARILSKTLDKATGELLERRKSPSRKSGELDNRGSQYYLAAYWAKALSEQDDDSELKEKFIMPSRKLLENEKLIVEKLVSIQGSPADIGGYYLPEPSVLDAVMRPSSLLNGIIDSI